MDSYWILYPEQQGLQGVVTLWSLVQVTQRKLNFSFTQRSSNIQGLYLHEFFTLSTNTALHFSAVPPKNTALSKLQGSKVLSAQNPAQMMQGRSNVTNER